MSSQLQGPFRADVVGSFLRPEKLKKARADHAQGIISDAELKKYEDEAIADLIEKEKAAGLRSFTDGEFRRSWWHLDFFVGLQGIKKVTFKPVRGFQNILIRDEETELTGPISGKNHPFIEHFRFIKQFEDADHVAKLTIPSPAQLVTDFHLGNPAHDKHVKDFYPDNDEMIEAVAQAYRDFIAEVYAAGCRYLQFDEPSWGRLCNKQWRNNKIARDAIADEKIRVDNLALEGKPDDLTVTAHICRGNYRSSWASEGGYSWIADKLFTGENLTGLFLEYDTERAGGFEPLKYVTPGRKVILGLVSSKVPELENRQEIIDRIHEAAQYYPLEYLGLSPQCGFASTEEGNLLSEEEQWDKVKFVVDVAKEVWGDALTF